MLKHFNIYCLSITERGRHGRDHTVVGFTIFNYKNVPMQSVPITIKVVSLNPTHGEVYLIQLYVIKFISDLRQVGEIIRLLWFPPPIKLTATVYIVAEILLKVASNTITPYLYRTILQSPKNN